MRHPPLIRQRDAARKQPSDEVGAHDSNCLIYGIRVSSLEPLLGLLVELVNRVCSYSNPLVLSALFTNLVAPLGER